VGNQAMADRYAYLPFIGLFLMVCWGVGQFGEERRVPVLIMRGLSVVALVALVLLMDRQLSYWDSNVNLWQHTLAVTGDNYIAHDNLAAVLMSQGHEDEAVKHYQAALTIYPSDPFSTLALAAYDQQHGRFAEAIARYQKMIAMTPEGSARAPLFSKLGLVYLDTHDNAGAESSFAEAVAMDAEDVNGWLGLGVIAEQSGNLDAAIADYKRANDVRPVKVAYLMLARVLDKAGDSSGAQAARVRAKLLPGDEKTTQTYSGGILQK
jgi:protein O-mannosyl-transferase